MRIGIDMLAVQSENRHRGIGRISRELLSALFSLPHGHEFVLYVHAGFPLDMIPRESQARHREIQPLPECGERTMGDALNRVVRSNSDRLDWFLTLSPFEQHPGYAAPAKPLDGARVAAVVYDFIPFLYPERYLDDPVRERRVQRRLAALRPYDRLLAISEATRADAIRLSKIDPSRVINISSACRTDSFRPNSSLPAPTRTREVLTRLGIVGPYILHIGGMDDRKNHWRLLDAFAALPARLRLSHQLVMTHSMTPEYATRVRNYAAERGLDSRLVLTGEILDDAILRTLYQRCAVFALPSLYEGFGLPLLEALQCGAVVLAGDNSSQPEVVGEAGLLVNALDTASITAALRKGLEDGDLIAELRKRAPGQAARFSWEQTARRTIEALETEPEALAGKVRNARRKRRPRVAMVSPWPPKASGISDYAIRVVDALEERYEIDLYHDAGYVPHRGLTGIRQRTLDYRLLPRHARVLGYDAVIYQMGNSYYHGFLYKMMLKYPGIVTLHDFNLAAFQFWQAHLGGVPMDNFRREIEYCYPADAASITSQLWTWASEPGGLQEACSRRSLHMNRRVLDHSEAVIVHSSWCVDQVRSTYPELVPKMNVVPMGATPRSVSEAARNATRDRFGLPRDALLLGSFGILAHGKMNEEAILAFEAIMNDHPEALFVFVGQDWENGQAQGKVVELGIQDRVRFLGRQDDEAFADLIAAVDIGVALRRPPTYGETSAALLDLLRHGIPTVITNVATFSGYPDDVVEKVRWESDGLEGLIQALRRLVSDPASRTRLGQRAKQYVTEHHSWARVAELYSEVIENRARGRELPSVPPAPIPHGRTNVEILGRVKGGVR